MLIRAAVCGVVAILPAFSASALAGPVDDLKNYLAQDAKQRPALAEQAFAKAALSAQEAKDAADALMADWTLRTRKEREEEWKKETITLGGKSLRFKVRTFPPVSKKRPLYISLHGGGNAGANVNDQQWRNQIDLYKLSEKDGGGIYIAPRAPTDTWNLWHEAHIDTMFDRLIDDAVLFADADRDRVYILGYSAGGDGVYQLAPRMADRFAAASMMAGHPNEADPRSLRNLPFTIHVGENDNGFKRNAIAKEWGKKLDDLKRADKFKGRVPAYEHLVKLHTGKGHWMDREDAEAIGWMAKFTRPALADLTRVVWFQDDVTHDRLYWLAMPESERKAGVLASASISTDRAEIRIDATTTAKQLVVLLRDDMVNLDKPVRIAWERKKSLGGDQLPPIILETTVTRTIAALAESLAERPDPAFLFPARVAVERPGANPAPDVKPQKP